MPAFLAAAGIAFWATAAAASTAKLKQAEIAPYLHPQRLVDIGGRRLNLYCTGHGSPAVILDAGQGETMETWRKVQPEIAKFTQVCSYDRAGMGFSDGGPLPRDAKNVVSDLHALLHRAGIPAPYVLVGHSEAGLYEPLYADEYPREVAGMVLVDPAFAYENREFFKVSSVYKQMQAQGAAAYASCYQSALHHRLSIGSKDAQACGYPTAASLASQCKDNGKPWCEMADVELVQAFRPAYWQTLGSEDASDTRSSAEVAGAQRNYGALPLIILTAADDIGHAPPIPPAQLKAIERVWWIGHKRLARTSTVGINFLVHHSEHFIQLDRPTVVISAINEVVSQARR
jgi:pimeloyl-ACP methyl ester carboxylesterase